MWTPEEGQSQKQQKAGHPSKKAGTGTAPKTKRIKDSEEKKKRHIKDAAVSSAKFKTMRAGALVVARERDAMNVQGVGSTWTRDLKEVACCVRYVG